MTAHDDRGASSGQDYRLRAAVAERAMIGLLALSNDATIEAEWRELLAIDGVEFYR
jgi:hypothetical protein